MGSATKACMACAIVYIAVTFGQLDLFWPLHTERDFRFTIIFTSFALWSMMMLWES